MTEKQLMAATVELARLLGYLVYHPFDSRRSVAGFPDLTMCRGSRLLFVELKTEKGIESVAQLDWSQALHHAGAETYLWRPKDWLDGTIEATLRREVA